MPEKPRFLVSLHDVTPRHAATIDRILGWMRREEILPVPLLVVPDFHGGWPLARHPDFCRKLVAWRGAGNELVLHGYFHLETRDGLPPPPADEPFSIPHRPSAARRAPLRQYLSRRFLTGGEGEFLALEPWEARERLERGLAMWRAAGLGERPAGFIPPAWLHDSSLDAVLGETGFSWTENHRGVRYMDGRTVPCPVLSWASRDAVRRLGSSALCPWMARAWAGKPLVRVALHPNDFAWPSIVASIERTIGLLRRTADPGGYPHAVARAAAGDSTAGAS